MTQQAFEFLVKNLDIEEIEDQIIESISKFVTPGIRTNGS